MGSKIGDEIYIKKCQSFNLNIPEMGYNVIINNISTEMMMLLCDTRNKVRLVRQAFYLYNTYDKVKVGLFIDEDDIKEFEFMINSISKTKVVLMLIDGEQDETFIFGSELTEEERVNASDN